MHACVQFIRSPRSRYIRIFEEGIGEVITINVKDSTSVTYPTDDGRTLTFYTDFSFTVNRTYYVLIDSGKIVISVYIYVAGV